MKIAKITYTTTLEFAEQNQKNIQNVMSELRKLEHKGINYNTCLCEDGKTFIHTAFFEADEDQDVLSNLSSFKHFQEELRKSGLESPPKAESLSLVGSSRDIF